MLFEWDARKAARNEQRHRVSFAEAMSCFFDPGQLAFWDPEHSDDEDRDILFARSSAGRVLAVIYTLRGESVRIISARRATRREVRQYEEGV